MKKLESTRSQLGEFQEKEDTKKTMRDFNFQIPEKGLENGFLGDLGCISNGILEYTSFDQIMYPGKFQNGKWESLGDINEDTFMLVTTCYSDDLYSITVIKNSSWDMYEYPPENHYPNEMYDLFHKIQDKRDIKLPLLDFNPEEFKDNSIVLNKLQLVEFINDMKLDIEEFFKEGEISSSENNQDVYQETDDGYEIKNLLPTEFSDMGTFQKTKVPIEECNNGDIYLTAAIQSLSGNSIGEFGLDKLVSNIKLVCMPDNLFKVSLDYKYGASNSILDIAELVSGDTISSYTKLSKFISFIQNNLKKEIELSKKWGIRLPLSSKLYLTNDVSDDLILTQIELEEFLKDLAINEKVVFPKDGSIKTIDDSNKKIGPIIFTTLITKSGDNSNFKNMDENNFRSVKTPGNMVARSFLKANLNGEDAIKSFYLRTKTGDIYKVFKPGSHHLDAIVKDQNKLRDINQNCPTERLLFNPKKGNLVGIENSIIECGKPFVCAKNLTTSPVVEIVGFRGSKTVEDDSISLVSTIEQEYKQQKKQ